MNPHRPTSSSFEDPELKSAIRRAWGSERAPTDLIQRVKLALAREVVRGNNNDRSTIDDPIAGPPISVGAAEILPTEVGGPAIAGMRFWKRAAFALSAAAVVLVAVGLPLIERRGAKPTLSPSAVASLPQTLADALVHTHDNCVRLHLTDHHSLKIAPKNNFPAIAKAMSARLNHPVIARSMGNDWEFRGASICPVGEMKSAHLVYAHDDAALSVFSLPASAAMSCCPDHQNCQAIVHGHPLAGFVEHGGFFCVVASPGAKSLVDVQQVNAMRDQLHGDVIAAAGGQTHTSLVASMSR